MSLSSNASNVLLAKCRCRFGRRLDRQQIHDLVNCRSVQEVAAYLKQNTHYDMALMSIDPTVVHRTELESILRSKLYEDFSSLCRYELSVGEWFVDYLLMRSEIKLIMSYLWMLSSGRQNEFVLTLPTFYIQRLDLDVSALSRAGSYDDFLLAMRRSRFIKLLRTFTPLKGEPLDCALIEHALYRYFYEQMIKIVKGHYSGAAEEELLELLGAQLDIQNICHLYRMKKYYGAEPSSVRAMMLTDAGRVRNSVRAAMINAPTAEEALSIFIEKTPYGRLFDENEFKEGGIESATRAVVFGKALKLLRFSVHPTTVLLSFIILQEAELQDIVTIIEGVHYGLPPEQLLPMMTIDNFSI